jgi:CheY-like chemotaxis protein
MGQLDRTHERLSAAGLVLIVEDNFLVGAGMQSMLEEVGYEVLGPAATVATALAVIKLAKLDAVVLDLNLSGEKSYAVVDELTARNIPFVITSGYATADLPEKYRHHPMLAKPFAPRELSRRLAEAMVPAEALPPQALRQQ